MKNYYYLINRQYSGLESLSGDMKECKLTYKFTDSTGAVTYIRKSKNPILVESSDYAAAKQQIKKIIKDDFKKKLETIYNCIKWEWDRIIEEKSANVIGFKIFYSNLNCITMVDDDFETFDFSLNNPFLSEKNKNCIPKYHSEWINENEKIDLIKTEIISKLNFNNCLKIVSNFNEAYYIERPDISRMFLADNNQICVSSKKAPEIVVFKFSIREKNIWYGDKKLVEYPDFLKFYSIEELINNYNERTKNTYLSEAEGAVYFRNTNKYSRISSSVKVVLFSKEKVIENDGFSELTFEKAMEIKKKSKIHLVLPLLELHTSKEILIDCLRFNETDIWLEFKNTKIWLFNYNLAEKEIISSFKELIKKQLDSTSWATICLFNEVN